MNKTGRIWQVADSIDQAKEWAELYLRRGAIQVDLKPHEVRDHNRDSLEDSSVGVIITMKRTGENEQNPVLLYNIGSDEWMTDDYALKTPVLVKYDSDTLRAGVIEGRRTTELASGTTITEYLVQFADDERPWIHEDNVSDDFEAVARELFANYTGG